MCSIRRMLTYIPDFRWKSGSAAVDHYGLSVSVRMVFFYVITVLLVNILEVTAYRTQGGLKVRSRGRTLGD